MVRLLLHSQDSVLQQPLAVTLGKNYSVRVEANKDKVQQMIARDEVDVLILDLESGVSAAKQIAFLAEIKELRIPVVAMTDDDSRSTAMELVQQGVYDYFRKPPSMWELKFVVGRAHELAQLKQELEKARIQLQEASSCDQLLGSSWRMRSVYDLIRRVANLNAFVLITGESGTGKELVARHSQPERPS
jgi:DNA-binding NtrC family response regulator